MRGGSGSSWCGGCFEHARVGGDAAARPIVGEGYREIVPEDDADEDFVTPVNVAVSGGPRWVVGRGGWWMLASNTNHK